MWETDASGWLIYLNIERKTMFVFNGSAAVVGEGLTLHSVGLLWTSDQPYLETYTWQYTTLDRAATGIGRSVLTL